MSSPFPLAEDDVIAAGYSPGFSIDLTYWRVLIDSSRYLRQEVIVRNCEDPQSNEILRYTARLAKSDLALLWEIVHRIEFEDFKRDYKPETVCATDCATHWVSVRFKRRIREVSIYNLKTMVEFEKNSTAIGFLELWEGIHQGAPHGKVPVEEGRPKPWWRFW